MTARKIVSCCLPAVLSFTVLLTACGGGGSTGGGTGGGGTNPPPSTANEWTWMGGSNTVNAVGVYGSKGVASASNVPGARVSAVSWTDSSGNLWLFGGEHNDSTGATGELNDLWEFSPTTKEWTWVSGSSTVDATAVYDTQGVASANNTPGAGEAGVGWTDSSGNLWLFGGDDYNDLWEFNTSTKEWTWISGSSTANQPAVYGTQGVASASNTPGAGWVTVGWTDSNGNFWFFGGEGADVWKFSPTIKEWTWVSGSSTGQQPAVYGTQGVASASSTPGERSATVGWTDNSGNLWLYGGLNGTTGTTNLADLWKFNTSTKEWTWVGGSSKSDQLAVFGAQGVASASNTPGGRYAAVGWTDSSGNFWLFGGIGGGNYSTGALWVLNDLWKFSPTTNEWTWVSGSDTPSAPGIYGTEGVTSGGNVPGDRYAAASWTDSSGNFWFFGGDGQGTTGNYGWLNDLWEYQP